MGALHDPSVAAQALAAVQAPARDARLDAAFAALAAAAPVVVRKQRLGHDTKIGTNPTTFQLC